MFKSLLCSLPCDPRMIPHLPQKFNRKSHIVCVGRLLWLGDSCVQSVLLLHMKVLCCKNIDCFTVNDIFLLPVDKRRGSITLYDKISFLYFSLATNTCLHFACRCTVDTDSASCPSEVITYQAKPHENQYS